MAQEGTTTIAEPQVTLAELLGSGSVSRQELALPATHSYISHLTSLPLDTLLTEPSRLATESDILSADLTQLCHSQHKTFLSLRSASNALANSLGSLTASLDAMLDDWIPSLESEARMFTENTKSIQQSRQKAALVLDHHEKLLDVLELPHLLATCVKNGYYSEALDLAGHFERNLVSTLPPTTLLESVHTSVVASLQTLLQQLLQQLRSPAKLPVLFKTVNLLRRMEVCSEEQLAMAFILGRSAYLDDAFANASSERDLNEDPARWLRKWAEVFREGVYDVVTQYSSIFLPSASPAEETTSVTIMRSILTNFTHTYLNQLLSLLRSTLPKISSTDMSSLSSLVTQLSYCASSFARVGLDFRIALQPIVEDAVLSIVGGAMDDAADVFVKTVGDASRTGKKATQWLLDPDASPEALPGGSRNARRTAGAPSTTHAPPQGLVALLPIAVFTNSILQALNALRLVAMPAIYERVRTRLDSTLVRVSNVLLEYARVRISSPAAVDEDGETPALSIAAIALWNPEEGALPYLAHALSDGVYANHHGTPVPPSRAWLDSRSGWIGWAKDSGSVISLGEESLRGVE